MATMRRATLLAVGCAICLLVAGRHGYAQGPSIYVIGGHAVTLSRAGVKEVFLADKMFAGSVKLIVVDNAGARAAFLSRVLGMSQGKYESIWAKKAFRDAVNPPKVLATDADVVEFVKRTPEAVGYVLTEPSGVTVIQKQ